MRLGTIVPPAIHRSGRYPSRPPAPILRAELPPPSILLPSRVGCPHTRLISLPFKRSIDGTYHHVSEKHLGRYLGEFDYRYSSRKVSDGDRAKQTIINVAGKRLTYKGHIGKLEN